MRNNDVKKMQQRLKELGYFSGSADGVFGQQTEKYVKYFQQLNGLTQDGIAGKKTLAKLYSDNCPTEKKARRSTSSSGAGSGSSGQSASEPGGAQDVIAYAKTFLGVPYVYGASGPDAFDCTGFTCYVYKKFGISLPRSAQTQGYNDYGTKIDSIANLQPGDLVFFNTISDNDLSDHAGIYIGEGKFIHATSYRPHGRQVVIGTLASGSYNRNFSWGRRVLR